MKTTNDLYDEQQKRLKEHHEYEKIAEQIEQKFINEFSNELYERDNDKYLIDIIETKRLAKSYDKATQQILVSFIKPFIYLELLMKEHKYQKKRIAKYKIIYKTLIKYVGEKTIPKLIHHIAATQQDNLPKP